MNYCYFGADQSTNMTATDELSLTLKNQWKMFTYIFLTNALSIETKFYLHIPCIYKFRVKETEKQIMSPLNN